MQQPIHKNKCSQGHQYEVVFTEKIGQGPYCEYKQANTVDHNEVLIGQLGIQQIGIPKWKMAKIFFQLMRQNGDRKQASHLVW